MQIEYFPLRVGEQNARLELYCQKLSRLPIRSQAAHDARCATPAAPEKTVRFESALGASDTKTARFLNYAKQKTDYICKACSAAHDLIDLNSNMNQFQSYSII